MKIDLFYILNEIDLIEVRFNILDPYVDKFIVVEATETFSGYPKDPIFNLEDPRWAKWKHKIDYYLVDDFPLDKEIYDMAMASPTTGAKEHYWVREFYIKESARKALEKYADDDIVFISDCDEIWEYRFEYDPVGDEVFKPKQKPYLYYFNQRTDEDWLGWTGTTVCRNETIKNGVINHIRNDELQEYIVVPSGGWHFNSIGGKERKVNASKHPIVNMQMDWDRREVNMRKDEEGLPRFLIDNKDKYPDYFL